MSRSAAGDVFAEYAVSVTKRRSVWIREDDIRSSGAIQGLLSELDDGRRSVGIPGGVFRRWLQREATLHGDDTEELLELLEVRIATIICLATPIAL